MSHQHHHTTAQVSRMLIVCSIVNLLYVAIEAGVGLAHSSAGLVSDAGHNLSDVITLLLSLAAVNLAAKKPSASRNISIVNALLLLVAVGLIVYEGISKIICPEPIEGSVNSITAGIGIFINGLTAYLLMKDQDKNINIKASFLHMLSDTLVSVGVLVSGIIITKTQFYLIDPILSLLIAIIILVPAIKLLRDTIRK